MTIARDIQPPAEASELLKLRYDARAWLWKNSGMSRVRACGRVAVNGGGSVGLLRFPDGNVVGSGLQHCMSVWACPVCSARLLQLRASRLSGIIDAWRDRGGAVAMVTLTMSHDRGDTLKELWDDVQDAWTACIATPAWRRAQDEFGVVIEDGGKKRIPVVRAVETTWGPSTGWHVHIHALLFLPDAERAATALGNIWLGDETTKRRTVGMLERWQRQAAKRGRHAVAEGQDAHVVVADTQSTVADYLAKSVLDGDISKELARGDMKVAAGQRFTPFQLLALVAGGKHPEKAGLVRRLWREWEDASRGRRQMALSRGLADYLAVAGLTGDDETDGVLTDIAADAFSLNVPALESDKQHNWRPAGPPELIGLVRADTWRDVVAEYRLDAAFGPACERKTLDLLFMGQGIEIAAGPGNLIHALRDTFARRGVVLSERYVTVKA